MPGTVTVASKLPYPLHIDLFTPVQAQEPVMGGGWKEVTRHDRTRRVATIQGVRRREDDPRVVFGHALTHNVDADGFDAWLKANADSELVKRRLIFAMPKPAEVENEARKLESNRSGLESLDPQSLPNEFRRRPGQPGIETAKKD